MTKSSNKLSQEVWRRASEGGVLVVVGPGGVPAAPGGWWSVRVRCDGPPRMLGPIHDAHRQVDRLVGSQTPVVELAADRFRTGLRRRLLGDEGEPAWSGDGDIVAELNRLADMVDGPSAFVFDAIEAADAATLAFLSRVAARPGWLRPSLLLGLRTLPTSGPVLTLIDRVRGLDPTHVVHVATGPDPAPTLPDLSDDVRQVLRAAAVIGEGFEAALVAHLLGLDTLTVLLRLQRAVDQGVALDDLGEGHFHLPPALVTRLRQDLLPSLAGAWNRRLARHLAGEPSPSAPEPDPDTSPAPPPTELDAAPVGDPDARARAAGHSAAAGDVDEAVQRYLGSARELADQGASDQALAYAENALSLLERLPLTPERKRLAALAHATTGRLRWQAGTGGEEFTLGAADKSLKDALKLLADSDDVALRAEVRRLRAAVAYDQGDPEHLERGLKELTEAIRDLSRAGEPRAAARLLNDQAAVLVALGDPVRASSLLEESLQTFQTLSARTAREARREGRPLTEDESADRAEVAETLHLLASLPMHVAARPGREQEALERAMAHASEAEQIYQDLGLGRELGRVWQTHGQLARRAGDQGAARELLHRAARGQLNLGDAIGLARTTEAMASLLGDRREHAEALRLLVDSIRLNHGKGSPRGLAFNRRTLTALAQDMTERERQDLAPMIVAVRRQLEAAEAQLGRVELPPASA